MVWMISGLSFLISLYIEGLKKNNFNEKQVWVLLILNFSNFSDLGSVLLNLFGPLLKSKSVVYMVTSCPNSEISRARSTAKNTIPPNCVAGNEAGHTNATFMNFSFSYAF